MRSLNLLLRFIYRQTSKPFYFPFFFCIHKIIRLQCLALILIEKLSERIMINCQKNANLITYIKRKKKLYEKTSVATIHLLNNKLFTFLFKFFNEPEIEEIYKIWTFLRLGQISLYYYFIYKSSFFLLQYMLSSFYVYMALYGCIKHIIL